ncbi:hypothetical protein [Streptomyces sp. WY228]|uniref:hypothetical protein n=1 Tax=Streptomyces sp. WY228 TaxID=2855836 RepID=UPI001C4EBF6D|nr:hypothetical protein [Streptomyces sp. WY228]QXQ94866.1 hypothetical protein KV381_00030 [Streptomyces sp. WY228]
MTAREYLGEFEKLRGDQFDPDFWLDALLRKHPREAYVEMLAFLNRAAPFKEAVLAIQQRFLAGLGTGLRTLAEAALAGAKDGQPQWFIARQPTLRAMRLVLTSPVPRDEPDSRVVSFLGDVDLETASILLVHLVADTLERERPEHEAKFGGMGESLAKEVVCNQIFNEPKDVGSAISRTWSLWTHHGANQKRENLPAAPVDLLAAATGLDLVEILAPAFAYWLKTTETRLVGPVRVPAFPLLTLPNEKIEKFLALYSATLDDLAAALAVCDQPWQMLPLQTTPLLRVGDTVVVLDEPFLWEAVTSGLYWPVQEHLRATGGDKAWQAWSRAYAEMIELLAEDLIKEVAPLLLDGSSSFFTEDDIKAAFPGKKGVTPLNCDMGIDFGNSVVLLEIVNKPMTLAARSGDLDKFKVDAEKAVVEKTKQLDGTAKLLLQSPQTAGSPLAKPAEKVYPVVVCGNGFPLNPVTRNHVEERLKAEGWLQQSNVQPLAVVDLDELETCASLAKAGELLPDVLSSWLNSPSRKGSLTVHIVNTHGCRSLKRPAHVRADMDGAFEAIHLVLNIQDDPHSEPEAD